MTDYNLPMTVEEICRDYRQAKDKKGQIEILADRNVCTKEAIEDVLRSRGEELPEVKPVPRAAKWTVQEEDRLRKLAGDGKTSKEIAELMDRTHKAVEQKLSKMHISLRQQPVKLEALPTGKDIVAPAPAPAPETIEPDRTLIELPLKVVEGKHVKTGLTREDLLALLFDVLYTTDLNTNLQTVFARLGIKLLDHLKKGNTYEL